MEINIFIFSLLNKNKDFKVKKNIIKIEKGIKINLSNLGVSTKKVLQLSLSNYFKPLRSVEIITS